MKTPMKHLYYLLTIIIFTGITLGGCTEKTEETEVSEEITPEELKVQIDSLQSQMVLAWDTMIVSDDSKLSLLKRIIEELSYIESSSEDSIQSLKNLLKTTKQSRYTRKNINNERIDQYDADQEILMNRIYGYAASLPEISSYPMVEELKRDVTKLDQKVVVLRMAYDNYALPYNELIVKYPNTLSQMEPKYATLEPVGVFTIMEPEDSTENSNIQ